MTRYVALLRGINLGKTNRVAMADLRRMLAELGATEIATLLQSGNAVFTSSDKSPKLAAALSKKLATQGVKVPVIVRTAAQLQTAIDGDPFASVADDPAKHLLGFCSERPNAEKAAAVGAEVESRQAKGGNDSGDQWKITGDHIYLWCPINVHESIFATVKWDKLLDTEVTMRNWSTVTKLLDMATA